jgi:hypothetical protein
MSRILYSALVSDMRGKLNGSVHTRNKGGASMRTKVTPLNPSTPAQSLQRSIQSDISKAWSNILTDSQRKGWSDFGVVKGSIGVFGDRRSLAGIAVYIQLNRMILAAGGTRIDDAPVSQDVPSILSMSLAASSGAGTLVLTFAPTPFTAPQGLYLFATPALSAGIGNLKKYQRFIGYFSAAASPLDITAAWSTVFGAFPSSAGQRIGVLGQVLDTGTGASSASNSTSTIVT